MPLHTVFQVRNYLNSIRVFTDGEDVHSIELVNSDTALVIMAEGCHTLPSGILAEVTARFSALIEGDTRMFIHRPQEEPEVETLSETVFAEEGVDAYIKPSGADAWYQREAYISGEPPDRKLQGGTKIQIITQCVRSRSGWYRHVTEITVGSETFFVQHHDVVIQNEPEDVSNPPTRYERLSEES